MADLAGKLIGILFCSRTVAHQLHLKTTSYAQHKALNEFYDEIVGLADSFAEGYQGRFEKLLDIPMLVAKEDNALKYLQDTVKWIQDNREKIVPRSETALQNILDEVEGLFYSTIYKLKFLK